MPVISRDWRGADPKSVALALRRAGGGRGGAIGVRPAEPGTGLPASLGGVPERGWASLHVTADAGAFGWVTALVRTWEPLPTDLPLAPLLDLRAGVRRPVADVARSLVRLMERQVGHGPLLLVAHQVTDPASLRVIRLMTSGLEHLPVLLVVDHPLTDEDWVDDAVPGDDSAVLWARERAALGLVAWQEERWLVARCHLGASLPLLRGTVLPPTAQFLAAYVQTTLARGELSRALDVKADLRRVADRTAEARTLTAFALGQIASAEGRYDEAWDHFTAAGAARVAESGPGLVPWREEAAAAALRTGRADTAQTLCRAGLAFAEDAGDPVALARALRLAAVLDDGGTANLRRALALLGDQPSRLRAQLELDLAARLLLVRDPGQEVAALVRSVEAFADRQQLNPLLDRVDRILQLTGAAPQRSVPRGVGSLSSQELGVANLAGTGLDDHEIATRLFLTEAEVAADVARVMRKLHLRLRPRIGHHLAGLDSLVSPA